MRMIVQFEKGEAARFVGHLDLMRAVQRTLRRMDIPLAYSAGFNPHPVLSFASAVAVGTESRDEYMDVGLTGEFSEEEFLARMLRQLPPGLTAKKARLVGDDYPTLMAQISSSDYVIGLSDFLTGADWESAVSEMLASETLPVLRETKKGKREVDARPMILHAEMKDGSLLLSLATGSAANLKPESVLEILCGKLNLPYSPEYFHIIRTALWAEKDGNKVSLSELDKA